MQIKKTFIINTGAFKIEVFVFINRNSNEIQKHLSKYNISLPNDFAKHINSKKEGTAGFMYHKQRNIRIIYLYPRSYVECITLFDHEKFHAIHTILDNAGLKLNDETEEVYAYTSEYLMKQFLLKIGNANK